MADLIIALPKLDDSKKLCQMLNRNGYDEGIVCDSGAQVMDTVNYLDGGIVICGYRLSDMFYADLNEYLPKGFLMLLLASPSKLADVDARDVITLEMPFKMHDLFSTLEMMMAEYNRWKKKQKHKPVRRTDDDEKLINAAKELLMERNRMTEAEAHRYIQRLSMNNSTKLVDAAIMILEPDGKEWNI